MHQQGHFFRQFSLGHTSFRGALPRRLVGTLSGLYEAKTYAVLKHNPINFLEGHEREHL